MIRAMKRGQNGGAAGAALCLVLLLSGTAAGQTPAQIEQWQTWCTSADASPEQAAQGCANLMQAKHGSKAGKPRAVHRQAPPAAPLELSPQPRMLETEIGPDGNALPPAPEAAPPASPPETIRVNVGVAWNSQGSWVTRTGATYAEAVQNAVDACNNMYGGCVESGVSVADSGFGCFAIASIPGRLFGQRSYSLDAARDGALAACQQADPAACAIQVASCNDHT